MACLLLGSLIYAQNPEDLFWSHCVGVMQVLSLPIGLLAAVLLGFLLRGKESANVASLGFLLGLWVVLAPEMAYRFLPASMVLNVGYLLLLLGFLFLGVRKPAWSFGLQKTCALSGVIAILSLAATFLVEGPPPSMGSLSKQATVVAPSHAPNLALIVLDTLRADHLGCYGYDRPTSPNLDRIASEGMLYRYANSVANHTGPSHATMFTGMLPSEHGLMSAVSGMPTRMPTVQGVLADAGYSTGGLTSNFVLRSRNGFNRGFDIYDDSLVLANSMGRSARLLADSSGVGLTYGASGRRNTDMNHAFGHYTRPHSIDGDSTTRNAIELVNRMTEREAPFFLFANYMDVHTPYQAPGNGMDRFLEHDPGRFKRRMTNLAFQNRFDKLQVEIDNGDDVAEEVGALMDRYDAEIAFVDQQLPALLQHLQKVSDAQGRKLLVVITSDHGEGFGEHNILAHGRELWQETLHVPLITWGSASPQGVVEEDVSLIDLASTFTAAAGLESLGRSQDLHAGLDRVLGHLMAEEGPSRSLSHFAPMHRVAVYGEGRKMIYDVEEEAENFSPFGLFDLRADPLEQSPLAETEVTALTERLQSWADRWWRLYLAGREMEAGAELNSMDAATLAELGYTSE